MSGRRELLRLEVPFAVLAGSILMLAGVFSLVGIPSWIPPAPMLRAGVPSPLTGMARSFVALASGDLGSAFGWHPLGPLAFVACLSLPVLAALSWLRGRRFEAVARFARNRALWLLVSVAVAGAWVRQLLTF